MKETFCGNWLFWDQGHIWTLLKQYMGRASFSDYLAIWKTCYLLDYFRDMSNVHGQDIFLDQCPGLVWSSYSIWLLWALNFIKVKLVHAASLRNILFLVPYQGHIRAMYSIALLSCYLKLWHIQGCTYLVMSIAQPWTQPQLLLSLANVQLFGGAL